MHSLILASLLAVPSFTNAAVANVQVGKRVKTTSGELIGHASSWQPTVSEYLGVPFAAPPVGPLRWKAPETYNGAGKVFNAAKFVSPSL
jgi:carboxylesterase type B